jgi:hypothetical protein
MGAIVVLCGTSVGGHVAGASILAAGASAPVEGSQGTDTALPLTDSAVTVTGASALGSSSPFANLSVTVNQTQNLTNQAISVTWTGGTPTDSDVGAKNNVGPFNDNYLQMFECWGSDDHSNSLNPGPAPTGCEFGANILDSSILSLSSNTSGSEISRVLLGSDTSPYKYVDPSGGGTFMPFDPVDGAPINVPTTASSTTVLGSPGETWDNPYFDYTTTNEVDFARTYADGTGSVLFTVDTGLEAPGLGCGQQISQSNGTEITPQCWLVIVPRGTPSAENPAGTSPNAVETTALSDNAWAHRIAVPLGFNPIGSSCPLGAHETRIVGSELVAPAVSSWQPALCDSASSPPYQFSAISDEVARQEVLQGSTGGAGMGVISQPITPSTVNPSDPVTYAPLSLSAVDIGFNIDRVVSGSLNDPAEQALIGKAVQNIYLTPRLVAKLLTESYVGEFDELNPFQAPSAYQWLTSNPVSLLSDPDFLQFNPEFRLLQCNQGFDCGGLIVEQPTSDAAVEVWRWILSDPEAKAWLAGAPDPWGMKVNPYYTTNSQGNPSGVGFGSPTPNQYPKSDPYTYQNPTQLPAAGNQLPRPLDMQDFLPYATSMQSSALEAGAGNDGGKTTLNNSALSSDTAWTANGPQGAGSQFELAITDSADAAQYGLQAAELSRAGDDGPNRTFVAPDAAGIEAGEQAMQPTAVPSVLQPNVSTSFPGAYPLPMLTYAAVTAPSLDKQSCENYATFIDYAVGKGQVPGVKPGDLPPGYAPLDPTLVSQSTNAAQQIVANCAQSTASGSSSPNTGSGGGSSGQTGTGTSGSSAGPGGSSSSSTSAGTNASRGPAALSAISATNPKTARSHTGLTSSVAMALTRLVLPILLTIGLLAALLARWLDVWPRRVRRARKVQ